MSSNPALPVIEVAVIGICVWNLIKGMRTGIMHFGSGSISINCDRRTDRRGFWIYGTLNAATMIMAIWLLTYLR